MDACVSECVYVFLCLRMSVFMFLCVAVPSCDMYVDSAVMGFGAKEGF